MEAAAAAADVEAEAAGAAGAADVEVEVGAVVDAVGAAVNFHVAKQKCRNFYFYFIRKIERSPIPAMCYLLLSMGTNVDGQGCWPQ